MLYRLTILMLVALAICLASPTRADEVIAKYIEAIGGRAALDAHHSVRMTGIKTTGGGPPCKVTREIKRPNKLRLEQVLQEGAGILMFDGQTAYAGIMGDEQGQDRFIEMPGTSSEQMADIDGPLVDWRKKGHQVDLVGCEEVDGRPAYKLKLILKGAVGGECEHHFIDAESFLPVQVTHAQGETIKTRTIYGDFKKVEFNVDLPDERFARPACMGAAPNPRSTIQNDAGPSSVRHDGRYATGGDESVCGVHRFIDASRYQATVNRCTPHKNRSICGF